jgi:hypothetical protein
VGYNPSGKPPDTYSVVTTVGAFFVPAAVVLLGALVVGQIVGLVLRIIALIFVVALTLLMAFAGGAFFVPTITLIGLSILLTIKDLSVARKPASTLPPPASEQRVT